MSITPITTDQLRRIEDHDGLILQGCGGSLQEWQDGINNLLTENGILKDGSKFENIRVFQHEGRTCLLFPFTDDLQINMGKLAIWRLQSHEQFEGMWLSDYVDLRLGGPLQEQQHNGKPDCPLIGEDSNIFNLMAISSRTLKENGLPEQAREMRQRIEQSHSYDSALSIISDYVNTTSIEPMEDIYGGIVGTILLSSAHQSNKKILRHDVLIPDTIYVKGFQNRSPLHFYTIMKGGC